MRLEEAGFPAPELRLTAVFDIYEGAMSAERGRLSEPEEWERFLGKHNVTINGFEDSGETLSFVNSYGEGWGDSGFGYMPRAYYEKFASEAWALRSTSRGFNLQPELGTEMSLRDLARSWRRTPVRGSDAVAPGRRLRWYRVDSIFRNAHTLVSEVVDSAGKRLGWCHLEIGTAEGALTAVVTEMFVWPTYRGAGVAKSLIEWAREEARSVSCETLQVIVYDADAESETPIDRQAILEHLGMEWHCPPIEAAGNVHAIAGEYVYRA